jgi:preprotein translocase subunit SecG
MVWIVVIYRQNAIFTKILTILFIWISLYLCVVELDKKNLQSTARHSIHLQFDIRANALGIRAV